MRGLSPAPALYLPMDTERKARQDFFHLPIVEKFKEETLKREFRDIIVMWIKMDKPVHLFY